VTVDEAKARLARHLKMHHSLTLADVELIEDVPGYWQVKEPCPGGLECRHAFRGAVGPCDGGTRTTIQLAEPGRDARGRFLRPYRVWETLRDAERREGGG
jgi:hypothetical protein